MQRAITVEAIEGVVVAKPRRIQLATERPEGLLPPKPGHDWSLTLPFEETLWTAFQAMCPQVPHIGLRPGTSNKWYTYFKGSASNPGLIDPVRQWLAIVGQYVAIRDCLALSFALDYDREHGDPTRPHTVTGTLRANAKTYAPRDSVKNVALDEKRRVLHGTVAVDSAAFRGKTVLLVEDLYQPGSTINFVARRQHRRRKRVPLDEASALRACVCRDAGGQPPDARRGGAPAPPQPRDGPREHDKCARPGAPGPATPCLFIERLERGRCSRR